MIKKLTLAFGILTVCLVAMPIVAQEAEEGPALTATDDFTQGDIDSPGVDADSWLNFLRTLGLVVFTTPFNTFDGLGDGPFTPFEIPPTEFGHRPTLQGNGVFLRIHGLDAQSCNECHSLVSHAEIPPTLGIGGAGSIAQSAMPRATLLDIADSFEDRVQYVPGHDPDLPMVFDGAADFNGRFINAPFLFGGGGVELVAKEMTADLQEILKKAKDSPAGTVITLKTHGTFFGYVTSLGGGKVELELDGIGDPDDPTLTPEQQLVVRPFGRKGENFSMRDFDRGAMQFHFGMQPTEVVGFGNDEDNDGVVNEITDFEMSVLHIFDVTNPRPFMEPLDLESAIGYENFKEIGCANCHHPDVRTYRRNLPLTFPEVAENPYQNVYLYVDLTQFGFDPQGLGVNVPMFADLKRHDMGDVLEETLENGGERNREFTTARLWGIADSAPYLHDGRATTLNQAIVAHGGEAEDARVAYQLLPAIDQIRLVNFLRKLRTPENPNEDILP